MTFGKGQKQPDARVKYGADNPASRFDGRAVTQIKKLVARGVPQIKIAQWLGCSASYVSLVVNGKRRARK